MAGTGYVWSIERFRATRDSVGIIKLDHFRGFEKHWEIARTSTTAINGKWVPAPGAELFQTMENALGRLHRHR